ncbi:MAG: hypothetical protein LIO86_10025 [Lachnospiraceae bacterium]|nr:hypothetical protein [Lachnospiraceae bacterium]
MKRLLDDLSYEDYLSVLAQSMEIRDGRPSFSVTSRLEALKKSLDEKETLEIKSSVGAADNADSVTVCVELTIFDGEHEPVRSVEACSRAFMDVNTGSYYDSRNYAYKNAYFGALEIAVSLLGFSSELILQEILTGGMLSGKELDDRVRSAGIPMESAELITGETRLAVKEKMVKEMEPQETEKPTDTATVSPEPLKAVLAEEEPKTVLPEESKEASMEETKEPSADRSLEAEYENALEYRLSATTCRGKSLRELLSENGENGLISICRFMLERYGRSDPGYEAYQTVLKKLEKKAG